MKQPEAPKVDKKYELECIARAIKEVEVAKRDNPEMYQEALASLKKDAKAILSIEDLKARAQELSEEPESKSMDDESDDEDEKND